MSCHNDLQTVYRLRYRVSYQIQQVSGNKKPSGSGWVETLAGRRGRFYSFKTINLKRSVPFFALAALVLILGLVSLNPPTVLFFTFLGYCFSGYVYSAFHFKTFYGRSAREARELAAESDKSKLDVH